MIGIEGKDGVLGYLGGVLSNGGGGWVEEIGVVKSASRWCGGGGLWDGG